MTVTPIVSTGSLLTLQALWSFLAKLEDGRSLSFATRVEDLARQRARRSGYAKYVRKGPDRGWYITDFGREALASYRKSVNPGAG